jgi:putative PIN family toxin of toxin-antitoxin system
VTRVVLDASVLASATVAHPNSPSARVLEAAKEGAIQVVACAELIAEFDRALSRPYFTARLTEEERSSATEIVATLAIMLPDPAAPPRLLRDARDDYLVALAIDGRADVIVTGDRDLLDHEGLEPPAITPRAACERVGLT